MFKLFLPLFLTTLLFSKNYTNCSFQNPHYSEICEKVVKGGVSFEYANNFLLDYFKTQKFDEVTWTYIQPRHIKTHKQNEKKANNTLVKYVPRLVEHLQKYKEVYDHSEAKYGVNREIVAAILMKETNLGKIEPKHDAFIVFNTILTRTKADTSRNEWLIKMSKSNMAAIIKYCYKKELEPRECNLASSYAGAVGIPQFMPDSFVYIDAFKSKVGDLTQMEDAIMSASKFLHTKAEFTTLMDWSRIPDMDAVEDGWYDFAFEHKDASFVYEESTKYNKKYKCFLCQDSKYDYLRDYTKKVMRYNNSSNYAVGVLRLAYDAHKLLNL
jgi:membrane-bound lytic murein transglycosylase B